jgi:hypothetical protein
MMRLTVLVTSAAVLAGCSSSSRVEGIVPGWANTHTDAPVHRNNVVDRGAPAAQSQAAATRPDLPASEE